MTDWFIFEEIPRSHYHLFESVFRNWGRGMKKDIGITFDIISVFNEGDMFYCFPRKKYHEAGRRILQRILKNPQWFVDVNNRIERLSNELISKSKELQKKDFSRLSDKELEKVFSAHLSLHLECHKSGVLPVVVEFEHELLSNYLKGYLKKRIGETGATIKVGETFSSLTIPHQETFQLKQEKASLKTALKILKNKKLAKTFREKSTKELLSLLPKAAPETNKEIEKIHKKYAWLPFMYIGPPWGKDYFVEQIAGLVKQPNELPKILKQMNSRVKEVKEKQKRIIKTLSIDSKHQTLFGIAQKMIYLKSLRKDAMYLSFYSYEPLLKEIGKRLGLSVNQLRFMWPKEFKKAILKKEFDPNELNERKKFSVYTMINGKERTLIGKKARELCKKEAPKPGDYKITEFNGSTAVPGLVTGTAKIINLPEDMPKMNEGDILVSHVTNPNLVPAMKKAAAIVTDIGGITSHAAIVSREMNVPCVVGTKIATKVLKDGDLVSVNANHGIIKKLKK